MEVKKIVACRVIEGSSSVFNKELKEALADGWELFGALHVSLISPNAYSRIDYSQEVVKYAE